MTEPSIDNESFESLDAGEQLKIFAKSPIKVRGDLIMRAHDPVKLTHALSCEELYIITREMDPGERSEVLRFATLPQLFFISDLDCWSRDQISPKGFIRWLETLKEADEGKLLAWLLHMDYETVVAGFQKFIRVLKPEWEYAVDEQLGDQAYFTLDQLYYILVEEENFETVRRTLEILFENHRGRYTAILEGILGEMEYELEEEAFRRRTDRLSDQGFPDYETASSIYVAMSKGQFESFPLKKENKSSESQTKQATFASHYPVLWSFKKIFLDDVLQLLGHEDPLGLESVYEEMAWLSNKLIVVHGTDLTSEKKMKWAAERVRSFINLGLEALSERDAKRAALLIRHHWLEAIFRYAMGLLSRLKDRARALGAHYQDLTGQDYQLFLNPPYENIFRGLCQRVPKHYSFEVVEDPDNLREFLSMEDYDRAELSLAQLEKVQWYFEEKIPDFQDSFRRIREARGAEPSLFAALGTLYVHSFLTQGVSIRPLTYEELESFIDGAFEKVQGKAQSLRADAKEDFLESFFQEADQALLLPVWGLVFQNLKENLANSSGVRNENECLWMLTEKKLRKSKGLRGKKVRNKK